MADKNVEELPAAEPEASAKGGNPWRPVFAIVVIMPVLNFLMAEYMIIPRMNAAKGGGAAAGHGSSSGGHDSGGGEEGHGGENGGQLQSYELANVVTNLSGSLKSRYLKVSFTMEGSRPDFATFIEQNRVKLLDSTLGILSVMTIADLEKPGIKNTLRSDLINAFDTVLNGRVVEQLYFSELVVQ